MKKPGDSRLIAPPGLSPPVRAFWGRVVETWSLSDEGLEILRLAVEARQRMLDAMTLLRKEGMIVRTKRGAIRAHPAARIRRDAEASFLQAMRQLGLEE